MATLAKSKRLKKELTLLNVYAIATGTTLSAGFFLLPGLAASQAGPAIILSYLIAAIPLIPAMLCMMELATAMSRAGGTYYFLDRSMGPLFGTIGGIGTWLALTLIWLEPVPMPSGEVRTPELTLPSSSETSHSSIA